LDLDSKGKLVAIDLAEVLRAKQQACIETCIGKLCIFSIRVMDQKNLLESLGGKLNDADPVAFLKSLIIQVCVP